MILGRKEISTPPQIFDESTNAGDETRFLMAEYAILAGSFIGIEDSAWAAFGVITTIVLAVRKLLKEREKNAKKAALEQSGQHPLKNATIESLPGMTPEIPLHVVVTNHLALTNGDTALSEAEQQERIRLEQRIDELEGQLAQAVEHVRHIGEEVSQAQTQYTNTLSASTSGHPSSVLGTLPFDDTIAQIQAAIASAQSDSQNTEDEIRRFAIIAQKNAELAAAQATSRATRQKLEQQKRESEYAILAQTFLDHREQLQGKRAILWLGEQGIVPEWKDETNFLGTLQLIPGISPQSLENFREFYRLTFGKDLSLVTQNSAFAPTHFLMLPAEAYMLLGIQHFQKLRLTTLGKIVKQSRSITSFSQRENIIEQSLGCSCNNLPGIRNNIYGGNPNSSYGVVLLDEYNCYEVWIISVNNETLTLNSFRDSNNASYCISLFEG